MKRFEYNPDGFSSLDESTDGEWVRYEDHAADRAALVVQLDEARERWRVVSHACAYAHVLLSDIQESVVSAARQGVSRLPVELESQLGAYMKSTEPPSESYRIELTRLRADLTKALEAADHAAIGTIRELKSELESAIREQVELKAERDEARSELVAQLEAKEMLLQSIESARLAQVAELTRERDEANRKLAAHLDCSVSKLESEVTRLTRERDEARKQRGDWAEREYASRTEAEGLKREVARLTEALAAAEEEQQLEFDRAERYMDRAEAAEARVRELEAEVSGLREALALESELVTLHAGGASRAEVQVRELTERVSQALTGLRPGSPVREALEEALRG